MAEQALALLHHFAPLADPRVERSQRHKLLDVIAVALCAILGGADDWVAVERFGNATLEWLRRFLEFWSSNIEGKLHSVKVGQARSAGRGRFRHVSTSLRLH